MVYNFEQNLKEIIGSCSESISSKQIDEGTDLIRDFDFNSLSFIQLIVELENCFGIEVDDEFLLQERLSPYKSLVEMLKGKLGEEWL